MKPTPERANCLRTCETTSTTGPHVRLVQNFGVANTTTNGRCAASSCATERAYSARSGCVEVVNSRRLSCVDASVGVSASGGRAPTEGEYERRRTTRLPRPAIAAPRGFASTQYVPGL